MEQYYKIAGLTVKMDTFGITWERASHYCCSPVKAVDFTVESAWNRVKEKHPGWSDDLGEYMCSGFDFYKKLLDFNGMMLHSSAVVVDDRAYLFTANPGTGKSTHTRLWLEKFGERAFILNDDKPAIRLENGIWYAYGTPWSGKHDISVDRKIPVAGIAVVRRADQNRILPYRGKAATSAVYWQLNHPKDPQCRMKLLELLDRLLVQVPVWLLECNMEPEAAEVAYRAMVDSQGNTPGKDK